MTIKRPLNPCAGGIVWVGVAESPRLAPLKFCISLYVINNRKILYINVYNFFCFYVHINTDRIDDVDDTTSGTTKHIQLF